MSDKDYEEIFKFFMFVCISMFILIVSILVIVFTISGNIEWFKDLIKNIF